MSCPRVADDDRLHAIDSVHTDDFGIRQYRKPAGIRIRSPAEARPKPLRKVRIARTQYNQHASPPLHSIERRGERRFFVAGKDKIDSSGQRGRLSTTTTNVAARRMGEDSVNCELVIGSLPRSYRG